MESEIYMKVPKTQKMFIYNIQMMSFGVEGAEALAEGGACTGPVTKLIETHVKATSSSGGDA